MQKLIQTVRARKATLAFAESCTGGLLSARLTANAGISDIFLGAVVSYSDQSKSDLLKVPAGLIKEHGAVSEKVALAMAQGVQEKFASTWALSITGIAGPSGGTKNKPVGTVCFAVCGPEFEYTTTQHFSGERTEIQSESAEFATQYLTEMINKRS